MVNYILSFCKITGASKIFKRHFYLPLLKPLTPKEALRTFKITGKWLLGAKIQHYIPVLLNHRKKRPKQSKNYGKRAHEHMDDFTYMTPILDAENESHKLLSSILDTKKSKGVFVYTVQDKKYNIVMQAQLESAIRDGDVIDVLVSQKSDKIIVKLKNFKKVPMEIQYYDDDDDGIERMCCGEGATSPEDEKFHHHGKYTMSLAKIFEDKEQLEEKWEEELRKMMRRRKRQPKEGSKEWRQMVKESMKHFDWVKFEEEARKVIEEVEEKATEEDIDMEIDNLENTKNVNRVFSNQDLLNQLPTMKEIPDIIRGMGNATLTEIEVDDDGEKRRISGVRLTLPSGKECFISGQMVHTEDGDVFVPGQTVENQFGLEYTPGITINIDNKPTLISGLIMGEDQKDPMFLPTQSTITADGNLTFAPTPEERPEMTAEKLEIKNFKRKLRKMEQVQEELHQDEKNDAIGGEFDHNDVVLDFNEQSDTLSDSAAKSSDEDKSGSTDDVSSIELNSSEMEELDLEAMRLKQEQQRLEIEKLKAILMDDGLEGVLANLEEKNKELKRRLEELRKLGVIMNKDTLVSYVDERDTIGIASRITENPETANRLSDILLTMTRRIASFREKNSINPDNINNQNCICAADLSEADRKFNGCGNRLKVLLKTAFVAANDVFKNRPRDQIQALTAIGDLVVDVLKTDDKLVRDLLDVTNTSNERNDICNSIFKQLTVNLDETRASLLRNLADGKFETGDEAVEKIDKVLGKEGEIRREAFGKIAKSDREIVNSLIQDLKRNVDKVRNEEDATEILKNSISSVTITSTKRHLQNLLRNENDSDQLKEDALGFAQALGLERVAEELEAIADLRKSDRNTKDLLERTLLMRQLADKDYSLKSAIGRLKKNPERARYDPRIRQLVKESAELLLMTQQDEPIRNSREIPLQLLKTQNTLAIEDWLIRRQGPELPVLISKGTLQIIVPKEAERGVLAGSVPYALIDESGVTNFKPMHMFGANNINYNNGKVREGVRDRSSERDGDKKYLQAKSNVRKIKKLFNNSNRQIA